MTPIMFHVPWFALKMAMMVYLLEIFNNTMYNALDQYMLVKLNNMFFKVIFLTQEAQVEAFVVEVVL